MTHIGRKKLGGPALKKAGKGRGKSPSKGFSGGGWLQKAGKIRGNKSEVKKKTAFEWGEGKR